MNVVAQTRKTIRSSQEDSHNPCVEHLTLISTVTVGLPRRQEKTGLFPSVISLTCDLQICNHFNKLNKPESTELSLLYDSFRLYLQICYAVGVSVFAASLRRQLSCDAPCTAQRQDSSDTLCCFFQHTNTRKFIF
jgi:hypothetical protein